MAKGRITKRTVDAMAPASVDAYLWDRELAGFGLKVSPAGRKTYLVQYRLGGRGGRIRRYNIGPHGAPLTAEEARWEAALVLTEVRAGRDPAGKRLADRKAPSVAELAERFMAEHTGAKSKARTKAEYGRLFDRLILPALGARRALDVARSDVAKLHHGLRETPYQANRTLAVLSKLFNWAERHGERPDGSNPARHVERFKEQGRERFLSPAELARLGATLAKVEAQGAASPSVVAAIRLLIFTGARLGEVLGLRWEHVDFEGGALRLPDSKTGKKVVHLNAPAREVLSALPRLEGNPWVIAGQREGCPLVNLERPWRRIRQAAGLDDVRLHDLRHSFASVGAGAGLGLPIIGALLGHTQAQTTARYAHLADDPLKLASDIIAGRIADAMKSTSGGAVVPIRRQT
ncbi:MAG: DUF4102 domain-containing protein, partial [Alphaproteobacteria bacterium]|nr:DUF4102 domain-containing protein [Alphaproteobacteria bacterium]